MALPAVTESLDEVPEALHEHYREADGRFVLDVQGVDDHPGVGELKRAYERDKKRRKEAEDRLKVFEGVDPEEYRELLELRDNPPSNDEEIEARMKEIRDKYEGRVQQAETRAKEAEGKVGKLHTDYVLQKARADAAAALGKQGNFALLWPHIRDRVRPIEGEVDYALLDEDGIEQPMGMDKLIASMRDSETFQDAFYAPSGGGSGTDTNGRAGRVGAKTFDRSDPNVWADNAERIAKGEMTGV